jgi:hypothetical protein
VAGPSLMKAIRCWTKDPSQPPTVKVDILRTQNDANHAIETQTEIGWLHMFRGFVSIDWGHVNMEAHLIPNPSKTPEPGSKGYQESTIARRTTCFC